MSPPGISVNNENGIDDNVDDNNENDNDKNDDDTNGVCFCDAYCAMYDTCLPVRWTLPLVSP